MNELDALRCAKIMLDRHGDDAEAQATLRADALAEEGDVPGRDAWRRIRAAIGELRRTARRPGEGLQ